MESFTEKKITPEEQLVDELVGSGLQIKGSIKNDVPIDKQREIKSTIKKLWNEGASCEEIQNKYMSLVDEITVSQKNNENLVLLSEKISKIGEKAKIGFKNLDLKINDSINKKEPTENIIENKFKEQNLKKQQAISTEDHNSFENKEKIPKENINNKSLYNKHNNSYYNLKSSSDDLKQNKVSKKPSIMDSRKTKIIDSINKKSEDIVSDKVSKGESLDGTVSDKVSKGESLEDSVSGKVSNDGSLDCTVSDKISKDGNLKDKVFDKSSVSISKNITLKDKVSTSISKNKPLKDKIFTSISKNKDSNDSISKKPITYGAKIKDSFIKSKNNFNIDKSSKLFNLKNKSKFFTELKFISKNKHKKSNIEQNNNLSKDNISKKLNDNEKSKEEVLVNDLVGTGLVTPKNFDSLDILNSDKFNIKVAVQVSWKNGDSVDQIQKTYTNLVNKYLNERKEFEEKQRIKREAAEFKRNLTKKRIKNELKNKKFVFEGFLKEKYEDSINNKDDEFQSSIILEKNMIIFKRRTKLRGKFVGEKRLLFSDILTIDYEKTCSLGFDCIKIHATGFTFTIRNKNKDKKLKYFYNKFSDRISNEKKCRNENPKQSSDADELIKWHNLLKEGIITSEEFEKKKKELLF